MSKDFSLHYRTKNGKKISRWIHKDQIDEKLGKLCKRGIEGYVRDISGLIVAKSYYEQKRVIRKWHWYNNL